MRRIFLGMPAGKELAEHLGTIALDQRGVRWTPTRNLHLTIEFLGPSREDQIQRLCEHLAAIDNPPLILPIDRVACIPGLRRPRVLAVRMEPTDELRSLYAAVRDVATRAGFPLQPPRLTPHITFARLKKPDTTWVARYLEIHSPGVVSLSPYRGNELMIFESNLTPSGAEYSRVRSFLLTAG